MAQKDKAEQIVTQVLASLNKNEQVTLLPRIVEKLKRRLETYTNQGEVVSAVALEKVYIAKLEKILGKKVGETVTLKNTIDKQLVGGIIIKFRDMVIDHSIKRQLEDLQQQTYEG